MKRSLRHGSTQTKKESIWGRELWFQEGGQIIPGPWRIVNYYDFTSPRKSLAYKYLIIINLPKSMALNRVGFRDQF